MKKIFLTLLTFLVVTSSFSQKASLTIDKKELKDFSSRITKNGYICVLNKNRDLKIYEPENLKLHKKYTFDFDVTLDYISDNAELISITRERSRANKFFKALSGKKKTIKNYYNLINGEKLVGFNEFGTLKTLKKELGIKGTITNGIFYTNTKQIELCYDKIRNKKDNNKRYYVLTTDLITNKTTYKKFIINDEILLPATRSYVHDYKLKKSQRKTTLYVSDYNDESFTLMTRAYEDYSKKTKYPKLQKTQLLKYDFEGTLLMNNILENKINPKMEFVDVNSILFPVESYDAVHHTVTSSATGQTYTTVIYYANEISMGYFYNPENTTDYYTYSVIKGIKSKDGAKLLVSKFNEKGNLIWNQKVTISEKKPKFNVKGYRSRLDISLYKNTLSISIANNKDDLFKSYHIDSESGDVSEPHNFEKIKYDGGLFTGSFYSNYIKVKSISRKNLFSEQTLRFYFLNNDFKTFINKLDSKRKHSLYTAKRKDNIFLNIHTKDKLTIQKF